MSKVTVAAIQMSCVADAAANLARAEALTRRAARQRRADRAAARAV